MNSLDVILVVILLAYAVSGYVQGFVTNLVATIGLLAGGLLAIAVVPHVLDHDRPTLTSSLLALGIVIGAAALGQATGTYVGNDLPDDLGELECSAAVSVDGTVTEQQGDCEGLQTAP